MIHVDVTELFFNPVRSGIQRVVREFIRRSVDSITYKACIFDPKIQNLVELTAEIVDILSERSASIRSLPVPALQSLLAAEYKKQKPVVLPTHGVSAFIPEVFFEINRARHYRWRMGIRDNKISMLFFDFIPWLFPDQIGVKQAGPLMPYLQLAIEVEKAAFISKETMEIWRQRILRQPKRNGVVLPLGSDGLGLEKQVFDPRRKAVVCLGSIDGRKNQHLIAQAFASLWEKGLDLDLVLIGYSFDPDSKVYSTVSEIAKKFSRLRHLSNASDEDVLAELRAARGTIYIGSVEGYGLPPVESLNAGIPVIVAQGTPSTDALPSLGQIRVAEISVASIASAIERFAPDHENERLWRECSALSLPSWDNFARETKYWLEN